jgi:hypothetical protein
MNGSRIGISVTLMLVVLLCLGCHWKNSPRTLPSDAANSQTNYDAEQRAAVSAIIKDMYVDQRTELLVIQHAASCPTPQPIETPNPKVAEMRQQMETDAFQRMPELARETIDDFHSRSNECHPLANKLDISVKYVLVGQKDLEPLFPKDEFDRAWSKFYAKYPNSSGIISFSNPGFNRGYTQAVVSTGRGCGGLCGAGYFVLLAKEHGVWTVKTKAETWVS